jgi:hypothetical protein
MGFFASLEAQRTSNGLSRLIFAAVPKRRRAWRMITADLAPSLSQLPMAHRLISSLPDGATPVAGKVKKRERKRDCVPDLRGPITSLPHQ